METIAVARPMTFSDRPRTPAAVWVYRLLLFGGLAAVMVKGDTLARALAIAAFALGVMGDRDGFARHMVRMVGFALAFLLAPALGPIAGQAAASALGSSTPYASGFGVAGVGLITVILVGWMGASIGRALRSRGGAFGAADRMLGATLGAAEGALAVAAFCWGLSLMREPLTDGVARAQVENPPALVRGVTSALNLLDTTPTGRALTAHNPLRDVTFVNDTARALAALSDPQASAALAESPEWNNFCAAPAIQRHLEAFREDPDLRQAAETRDLGVLLRSRAVREMAADPQVLSALTEHWDSLQRMLRQAGGPDVDAAFNAVQRERAIP